MPKAPHGQVLRQREPPALALPFTSHAPSLCLLQDLFCSLLLSECVYKAVDSGPDAALAALSSLRRDFPARLAPLTQAQFSRQRVDHRYMVATAAGTLYVAFMGTKELRDVLVDAAVGKRPLVWMATGKDGEAAGEGGMPNVHGGFLNRADGILVESLYLHAYRQGLRMVLCG